MPKPRVISALEAKKSLANRLVRVGDNIRQLATKFGARPYRVQLVWYQWTGAEIGAGDRREIQRIEVLPTPLVESLDKLALSPSGAGIIRIGDVRITEISGTFTRDELLGKWVPGAHSQEAKEPVEFFYEIFEDGRGDDPVNVQRFRTSSEPWRQADEVEWRIMLARVSGDPDPRNTVP